jgi:hypothetical protein
VVGFERRIVPTPDEHGEQPRSLGGDEVSFTVTDVESVANTKRTKRTLEVVRFGFALEKSVDAKVAPADERERLEAEVIDDGFHRWIVVVAHERERSLGSEIVENVDVVVEPASTRPDAIDRPACAVFLTKGVELDGVDVDQFAGRDELVGEYEVRDRPLRVLGFHADGDDHYLYAGVRSTDDPHIAMDADGDVVWGSGPVLDDSIA